MIRRSDNPEQRQAILARRHRCDEYIAAIQRMTNPELINEFNNCAALAQRLRLPLSDLSCECLGLLYEMERRGLQTHKSKRKK